MGRLGRTTIIRSVSQAAFAWATASESVGKNRAQQSLKQSWQMLAVTVMIGFSLLLRVVDVVERFLKYWGS